MSFTVLCSFVVGFYVVIWFFDSFFKSCMHYPYYAFLEGTGLKVGIFNFTWTTGAFNRVIYRWSKILSCILQKWYTCGYIFTIWIFLPFAIWILVTFIFEHFNETIRVNNVAEVKAMLPGVNIPASDFWVYFLAIAISTVFHELGHALAAAREDVQIISVGLYVFAIIPIAFVQLNTEHLNSLAIRKRLRIYSAGIWHNIVIASIALLLYNVTPVLFNVAYKTDVGLKVTDLTYTSPLNDPRGLTVGDIVRSINDCKVRNIKDWSNCLHLAHNRYGICTSGSFVAANDELLVETIKENDVVECCRQSNVFSFCFEYMEPVVASDSLLPGQYSCLKPRDMIQKKFHKCTEGGGYACPRGLHCLKPSLNNHTYLIIIKKVSILEKNIEDKIKFVIYMGLPYDLYKTVTVDQYFPRMSIFSYFSPTQFETFMRYIFMFSMGIAFINVIPCYGMDGHHIIRNLFQVLAKYLNKNDNFVTLVTVFTIVVCTGVTVPIILYLLYRALFVENM